MTPFPKGVAPTTQELFEPLMKITHPVDALQYFTKFVHHRVNTSPSLEEFRKRATRMATDSLKTMGFKVGDITPGVEQAVREKAEKELKRDIGYYAGYYNMETRERMERLFKAVHPIFGSVSSPPTPEEAFQCGYGGVTLEQLRSMNADEQMQDITFDFIDHR